MKTQTDQKKEGSIKPMEESFVTVCEAARILNRSAESVRAYERKGILPAVKTSRGMRLFREGDVRELAVKQSAKERAVGV
jgi:DNA-binding transcriptional MerR regulator